MHQTFGTLDEILEPDKKFKVEIQTEEKKKPNENESIERD